MELELLISFIGASVLLTLMPGPDNIFVLTESITKGQRNGIAISIGLCSGILIHTFAAATGLSIIIQKSAIAFSVIKYLGAAYLFYLAILATKDKKPIIALSSDQSFKPSSFMKLIRKGFFMNVLNPKVSLFFIAFLPQFISKSGIDQSYQMLALGTVFMIQAIFIFLLIAILAGRLTDVLNNARFWKFTKWSKVSVLALLGLTLAISKK
ncbi:MAG: LysE family translocator [Carboxylicivirga sp.]|jgi:threonine/homoserine/homoserine lactone efflux protein|nr:LysE family translocator [Carboxylicivirga sp.]